MLRKIQEFERAGPWRRLGFGMALAAVVWAMSPQPAPAQDDSDTIIVGIEGDPLALDPHSHSLWLTFRPVFHLFEGLVAQDLTVSDVDISPIVPALATEWEISEDRTVYTFKLREGVEFHDGTPWNAEAARFNFDRILNPEFEYYYKKASELNTWWVQDIESYEVVDEYTFQVNLKQPNAEFLRRLSQGGYGSATMGSPTAIMKTGNEDFASAPVGTGPFRFGERVFGERIVLERNADYWNPERTPSYQRLIFRPIVEVAAREQALLTGAVDIIATPSPDSTGFIEGRGFKVIQGDVPTIQMLWLNFREEELQDVRVRRAISHAIDRKGLANDLRRGQASPAHTILNIGGPGYDPDYRCAPYDPDKARELLAEAGYPDGFSIRMDWTTGGAGDVNTVADAEWFQRNLAAVGIDATIEVFDIGTYFSMMLEGMRENTHMMQISWGEQSFHWLDAVISPSAIPPNGFNSGYYDNPKVGQLLSDARAALSREKAVEHLQEIQDIVCEDMAFIPTHFLKGVYAMSPRITGFVLAPQHWHDMAIIDKE